MLSQSRSVVKLPNPVEMAFFTVRVRLPDSSGYASCPSGDTDYEVDYHKALTDATPDGFKARPPRLGHHWPKDSEGYTWVQLDCVDHEKALATLTKDLSKARDRLARVNLLAIQIQEEIGYVRV